MQRAVVTAVLGILLAGCAAEVEQPAGSPAPEPVEFVRPGVYEREGWKYDSRLTSENGQVIGQWGYLWRGPEQLGEGLPRGRKMATPWGTMYYWGYAQIPQGPHGWLSYGLSGEYLSWRDHNGNPRYSFEENAGDFQEAPDASKALYLRGDVIGQARRSGVEFEFESDKRTYAVGEPIIITVHVINKSDRDVVLRPRSTYPSLFDFEILDNGQRVPWTVNMAANLRGDQKVSIPAGSRIQWSREDIVGSTKAGGGSAFSARGKHVLSFGIGNSVEITVQ